MGPTELGRRLGTSKQNVYGIFKRDSIDTELLHRIGTILEQDFFLVLSKMHSSGGGEVGIDVRQNGKRTALPSVAALERENEYLRRINALLEEKVAVLEGRKQESVPAKG
ncbi:MAG: hypothetical protein U0176_15790 [Bacteroidia bacterium]